MNGIFRKAALAATIAPLIALGSGAAVAAAAPAPVPTASENAPAPGANVPAALAPAVNPVLLLIPPPGGPAAAITCAGVLTASIIGVLFVPLCLI